MSFSEDCIRMQGRPGRSCPGSPTRSRTHSLSRWSPMCAPHSAASHPGRGWSAASVAHAIATMIELNVNGHSHRISADPDTPLLYVLREDLKLNAAKFGCGLGQCGACTVLIDGRAVLSCVTPLILLEGKQVTTLEGIGTLDAPAPIQRAF